MAYKAPGSSSGSVYLEDLRRNPGSFTTVANQTFDDFNLQNGRHNLSPARVAAGQTMAHDTTAYGTIPIDESWIARQTLAHRSPAAVAATGSTRNGTLESAAAGGGLT